MVTPEAGSDTTRITGSSGSARIGPAMLTP